jgi:transmembrane sensor
MSIEDRRRRTARSLRLKKSRFDSALTYQQWRGIGAYSAGVGEQRLVVLDDGTRMSLNTATRVRVDLGTQRTVNVEGGKPCLRSPRTPGRSSCVRPAMW